MSMQAENPKVIVESWKFQAGYFPLLKVGDVLKNPIIIPQFKVFFKHRGKRERFYIHEPVIHEVIAHCVKEHQDGIFEFSMGGHTFFLEDEKGKFKEGVCYHGRGMFYLENKTGDPQSKISYKIKKIEATTKIGYGDQEFSLKSLEVTGKEIYKEINEMKENDEVDVYVLTLEKI